MYLAGDIGGTHTRLALFEPKETRPSFSSMEKYPSSEHKSLEEIVQKFLQTTNTKVEKACFGISGPVKNGEAKATNLPWDVKEENLSKILNGSKTKVINDLEANAWGIEALNEEELFTLQEGEKNARGNRALISAGTGLGEAGLYFDGNRYHPFATEGGHADFAPKTTQEAKLLEYLIKPFGHVSFERVLSGRGLYNIFQFLQDQNRFKPNSELKELLKKEDPAKIITEKALSQQDPLCEEALDLFVSFYGAEAGNCALKYMAYGGVYIGGGIAPKIIDCIKKGTFIRSFNSKGRLNELLEAIPVKVILNSQTALLGAARCASCT